MSLLYNTQRYSKPTEVKFLRVLNAGDSVYFGLILVLVQIAACLELWINMLLHDINTHRRGASNEYIIIAGSLQNQVNIPFRCK